MAHLSDHYTKIPANQLKATTRSKLNKFWQEELKRRSLPFQYDTDGKLATVEQLGENFIEKVLTWGGAITENTEYVTLGELAASRENEQDVIQFEVQPSLVEKLISGTDGLLKTPLYRLVEVVYLPGSDMFAIGGGRHRVTALLTILSPVEGWENMLVPVNVQRAKTLTEFVNYVQLSNTTRSMTATEKTQIATAAKGYKINVFSDAEDIYQRAEKAETVTDLKQISRLLGVAYLTECDNIMAWNPTQNTLGDIGYKTFTKVAKALDGIQKGTSKYLTTKLPEGHVYRGVMENALKVVANNWDTFLDPVEGLGIAKPKTKRGSSVPETDEEGNTIWEYNLSRYAPEAIAEHVCELIVSKLGDKLVQLANDQKALEAQAKQAKQKQKAASSIEKEIENLRKGVANLESMGIAVPSDMLKQIEAKEAELQAKAEKLSAGSESSSQEVPEDMADLLA